MTIRGFVVGDRILEQAADSHADWCAAYGRLGAYRFIGASAIGKLHIRDSRPRDDAFAVRSAGEWLAVAVSDGMGSKKQSRYGASFAVEALCEHLLREAIGVNTTPETESAESQPKTNGDDKSPLTPFFQREAAFSLVCLVCLDGDLPKAHPKPRSVLLCSLSMSRLCPNRRTRLRPPVAC